MSAGRWWGVDEPRKGNHRRITSVGLRVSAPLLPLGKRYIDLLTLSGEPPLSRCFLPHSTIQKPFTRFEPIITPVGRLLEFRNDSTRRCLPLLHPTCSWRVVFNALYILFYISFCVKIVKDIPLPLGLFFHRCQACTPADCLSGSPECPSWSWYSGERQIRSQIESLPSAVLFSCPVWNFLSINGPRSAGFGPIECSGLTWFGLLLLLKLGGRCLDQLLSVCYRR